MAFFHHGFAFRNGSIKVLFRNWGFLSLSQVLLHDLMAIQSQRTRAERTMVSVLWFCSCLEPKASQSLVALRLQISSFAAETRERQARLTSLRREFNRIPARSQTADFMAAY